SPQAAGASLHGFAPVMTPAPFCLNCTGSAIKLVASSKSDEPPPLAVTAFAFVAAAAMLAVTAVPALQTIEAVTGAVSAPTPAPPIGPPTGQPAGSPTVMRLTARGLLPGVPSITHVFEMNVSTVNDPVVVAASTLEGATIIAPASAANATA